MDEAPLNRRVMVFGLVLLDLALAFAAYRSAFALRSLSTLGGLFTDLLPPSRYGVVAHYYGVIALAQVAVGYSFGLYDRFWHWPPGMLPRRVLASSLLLSTLLVTFYYFSQDFIYPRSIFLVFGALDALALGLSRALISWWRRRRRRARRVLLVGTGEQARELLREITSLPHRPFEVVGLVASGEGETAVESIDGVPVLGTRRDVVHLVRQQAVDDVILVEPPSWRDRLIDELTREEGQRVRLSIVPSYFEILIGRINHLLVRDIPLIQVSPEPTSPLETVLKRAFDLLLATGLALLTLPLMALIAAAIALTMGTPIFYRQERVGQGGRTFELLKFRTMVPNAEAGSGPTLSSSRDERITALGRILRRYRLDELPQLVNILRGEMSFVGPRPERPYFVRRYRDSIPGYSQRFVVKPGLTGLAQVRGGYHTSPENKLKHDLAYILNRNVLLDLRILLETVKRILAADPQAHRDI